MEGFSVTEAASVLGVPTERIWELLARGVLAGAPEGESGMRVFLQPRPAPAPPEPRPPNGHGAEPEREMSPFRELLTEFRNLTERYGQALLALGESRGEVASLRSRVDLLEARMDLRLPGGSTFAPPPPSFPVEHAVIPTAPEPVAPAAEPADAGLGEEQGDEGVRHRARGPRRATESFAEALARAEDPSPSELPDTLDATRARESDEATLPREVPAAEAVPVAEEITDEAAMADEAAVADAFEEAVFSEDAQFVDEAAAAEEPLGIDLESASMAAEVEHVSTEEAPAGLSPAEAPVLEEVEAVTVDEGPLETWDEAAAVAQPEPVEVAEPTDVAEPAEEAEPSEEFTLAGVTAFAAETDEAAAAVDQAETIGEESAADGPASEPEPLDWNAERYTTTIDEPDWFEAEVDDARISAPDQPPAPSEASATEPVVDETVGAGDEAPAEAPAEPADARPAVEPAEPAEGAEPSTAAAGPVPLPGSADLDRALDALRRQVIESTGDRDEWPPNPRPSPMTPSSSGMTPSSVRPPVTGPGRAYRRLRRIFPG